MAFYLVIVVTQGDRSPPRHHVDGLPDLPCSLVLEFTIDRERDARVVALNVSELDVFLLLVKVNHVTGAILEA